MAAGFLPLPNSFLYLATKVDPDVPLEGSRRLLVHVR
jgi:hypothetical protein